MSVWMAMRIATDGIERRDMDGIYEKKEMA